MKPVHVRIRNFQSIESLEMEINGLTIVMGKSNIGKSAIVRAISSALLNKPVTNMVRHGAKSSLVTLESEDWGLEWEKAERGSNRYEIGGKTLKNVGQGQLEDVAKMGFGSVRIGDQDVHPWLAPQWKPIFLLDIAGTAVTEFISGVARLKVLQDAIGMSLRGRRKRLDRAKLMDEELERLRQRESKFDGLDLLIEARDQLTRQKKSIDSYEERIVQGVKLIDALNGARSSIAVLEPAGDVSLPAPDLDGEVSTIRHMVEIHDGLTRTAEKVVTLKGVERVSVPKAPSEEAEALRRVGDYAAIVPLQRSVQVMEGVSNIHVEAPPELQGEIERLHSMQSIWEALQRAVREILPLRDVGTVKVPQKAFRDGMERLRRGAETLRGIETAKQDVSSLEQSYGETVASLKVVEDELSSMPLCPTCGQPAH